MAVGVIVSLLELGGKNAGVCMRCGTIGSNLERAGSAERTPGVFWRDSAKDGLVGPIS
jgi:hypothetical protein